MRRQIVTFAIRIMYMKTTGLYLVGTSSLVQEMQKSLAWSSDAWTVALKMSKGQPNEEFMGNGKEILGKQSDIWKDADEKATEIQQAWTLCDWVEVWWEQEVVARRMHRGFLMRIILGDTSSLKESNSGSTDWKRMLTYMKDGFESMSVLLCVLLVTYSFHIAYGATCKWITLK